MVCGLHAQASPKSFQILVRYMHTQGGDVAIIFIKFVKTSQYCALSLKATQSSDENRLIHG